MKKKTYHKPKTYKVKLIPEEATLKLCKIVPNGSSVSRCNCTTNKDHYS